MNSEDLRGLTTTEALNTLYNEILSLRNNIKQQQAQK